jgi:hypothetical protein
LADNFPEFIEEQPGVIAISQGMMTLYGIGQFYRFLFNDVFAPDEARHRVHGMHVNRVHDAGKRNPGNAGDVDPVILIGIALDKWVFFYVPDSLFGILKELINVLIIISIAKTELIILNTYGK